MFIPSKVQILFRLGCFLLLFQGSRALSNGGESAPSEHGGGEAPSSEHGGGEGSGGEGAEASGEKGKKSGNLPEWVDLQTKLQSTQGKIGTIKAQMEKLIEEKNELDPKSPQLQHIIQELVEAHRQYSELVESYRKQEMVLKYRFPERGQKAKKEFQIPDAKPLHEMEEELGLDTQINKTLELVYEQYQVKNPKIHSEPKDKLKPSEHSLEARHDRAPASANNEKGSRSRQKPVLDSPAYQFVR